MNHPRFCFVLIFDLFYPILDSLQARLDFLYDWAVDGPPPVMPLGLLARPRSFLTAVQQSFAEVLGRPVGQVLLEPLLLNQDEEAVAPRERLAEMGAAAMAATRLTLAMPQPAPATPRSALSATGPAGLSPDPTAGSGGGSGWTPRGSAGPLGAITLASTLGEGYLVGGLLLAGARWDRSRRCLVDPEPGTLHAPLPLLWLRATTQPTVPALARALSLPGQTLPTHVGDAYVCPVFKHVGGGGGGGGGGAAAARAAAGESSMRADSDSCLATLLLPSGGRRAEFWATHAVSAVATADPWGLMEAVAVTPRGSEGTGKEGNTPRGTGGASPRP